MNDPRLIAADALPDRLTDPPTDVGAALGGIIEIDDTELGRAAAIAGASVEDLIELAFDRVDQLLNVRLGGGDEGNPPEKPGCS